jgi:hypothetical protein
MSEQQGTHNAQVGGGSLHNQLEQEDGSTSSSSEGDSDGSDSDHGSENAGTRSRESKHLQHRTVHNSPSEANTTGEPQQGKSARQQRRQQLKEQRAARHGLEQLQVQPGKERTYEYHDTSVQQQLSRAGKGYDSDEDGDWSLGPSKKGRGKTGGRAGRRQPAVGTGLL